MIIALISGAFLTLWFVPSMGHTVYEGSYVPPGASTCPRPTPQPPHISFDVRGGLIIRQIHHWAALMFIVAIVVHMFRVFFTGAFRKPREINWVIGSVLALLAIVEGFSGYSFPTTCSRHRYSRHAQVQTAPVIGSLPGLRHLRWTLPRRGDHPRLYSAHILLLPAVLIGLFTAHIVLVALQKHTQFPGPGRTNDNVVGFPVMPVYAAKAGGFFFIVFGVISLMAAWSRSTRSGPTDPTTLPVTAGSQPDWYMGFADGALRLCPAGWSSPSPASFSMNIMPGRSSCSRSTSSSGPIPSSSVG